MTVRDWDASSYDRVGAPMTEMAARVLERLALDGDETVIDAGCGTGRVSELLAQRLPRGRVVAVDADPAMVAVARENLGARAVVRRCDLLELSVEALELPGPVDAVLSTATFHWIADHERLFARLRDVLRPGGRLVAQCGGRGNIDALRRAADGAAAEAPFAAHFEGWRPPWHYAGPEETAQRLASAGFVDVRTDLEPWPVVPDDPAAFLATVTLGAQVQRLPGELHEPYVAAVLDRLDRPVTLDYVRLNLEGRRPG